MRPVILLVGAAILVGGCTTAGGGRAVATPWGAGAVYSFRDKPAPTGKPGRQSVDAQVAQALDSIATPGDEPRMVNR